MSIKTGGGVGAGADSMTKFSTIKRGPASRGRFNSIRAGINIKKSCGNYTPEKSRLMLILES